MTFHTLVCAYLSIYLSVCLSVTCILERMNKDRSKLLKDVYGLDSYGVVHPTEWPPASTESKFGKKHYEQMLMEIDRISENKSVDGTSNSPGLSKATSRSDISFERMKIEKSREKLVMGAVATSATTATAETDLDKKNEGPSSSS